MSRATIEVLNAPVDLAGANAAPPLPTTMYQFDVATHLERIRRTAEDVQAIVRCAPTNTSIVRVAVSQIVASLNIVDQANHCLAVVLECEGQG